MSTTHPGELVDGRYRIQSRLGTGGMADVYLAEDTQLERQVALKLLHRRFAEDPGFVERFRREAQSAANLQHPNVVAVYDRGSWDGTYYIAMEYLQGRTLKQVIRAEAPLDPLRAIDITVQMLKATRFAHRRGVIHRDLKPHNVMLDDQDHAKVTDFGIARAGASDMTETGSIMGTAQYLSPEQAQGLAVAEGSDLYSIGIVLYEMLTGHLPFDAESAVTIALKHVSEAPVPPSRYNPTIPPALEQTVLWALNKSPADRPQDAEQFINVLEGIRESLTAGAGGQVTANMAALSAAGAAAGVQGPIGPRPRVQLGAAELTHPSTATHPVTGESGALPAVAPVLVAAEPPQGPEPRSRWSQVWPWLLGLLIALAIAGGVVAFILTRTQNGTVPVAVGLTQQAATQAVEQAGFNPQIIPQASTAPQGRVIFQHPLGTTSAKKGTTVDLTVSSGPGQTTVPPVVQLREKQAINELHLAGLKVSRVLSESSSTVPKGQATRTDPDAGVSLQTGKSVFLYISTGPALILVPDVRGDTLSTAQATLSQFTVTHTMTTSATATPGTVISQTPSGGAKELPGATISLVIAQKQPTVKLPDVKGQPDTTAESTLASLGLTVKTTLQNTDVQADDGVVISQSPGQGAKVAENSTVTLVIGRYTGTTTTTTTTSTTTTTTPPPVTTTLATPTTATTADQLGTTTAAGTA